MVSQEINILEIKESSDEESSDLPEIQDFVENMNLEVSSFSNYLMAQHETNHYSTTGLILEIAIAIKLSSDAFNTKHLLHKVLLDTGCTKAIIKNRVFLKKIQTWKQNTAISWTANSGNFVTKHDIPLCFTLPEFAPSREIQWNVAVDEATQQSKDSLRSQL
jgi:hypothetical protein